MENVSKNYNNAFIELKEIMNYMNQDIINKIPENVRKAIEKTNDKNYEFSYNKELPLYEQNILPETKTLLSVIYSDYLCDEEEKSKWDEYDKFEKKRIEESKEIKYNSNNLFDEKSADLKDEPKEQKVITENLSMTEYHESLLGKY